ncbi:MAG TPA: methyltransferase domain-containing protein [Thermoanaerobaculia bacterium]|nr:methyltransferase domain-containing protein [Thermoanaerobaculia bacterium]
MPADLTNDQVRAEIATVPHWYHQIEVRPGIVTPGVNRSAAVLGNLHLPDDCSGLRALDIGARDGYFSFELERRGADVIAVDYMPADQTGFAVASRLLGSRVPYLHENIYNLRPETLGAFDLVLCLGLLYHLPDPIRALRILRGLTRSRMILETLVLDRELPELSSMPLMRFLPGDTMNSDPSNYWSPNVACVRAMLADTEFSAGRVRRHGDRAIFDCGTTSGSPWAHVLTESSERVRGAAG